MRNHAEQNLGFHAPLNHPGFPNDGTQGDAGFSNAAWTSNQTTDAVSWSSETFAQNQNANAIRWGTLYNFRFDTDRPPRTTNATIGFFKTGMPITVGIQGPSPDVTCGGTPTPTPTPTPTANANAKRQRRHHTPTPTATAKPDASRATATAPIPGAQAEPRRGCECRPVITWALVALSSRGARRNRCSFGESHLTRACSAIYCLTRCSNCTAQAHLSRSLTIIGETQGGPRS